MAERCHRVRTVALRGAAVPALALALVPALTGCAPSVDQDEVAQQISRQLQREVGRAPDQVTCPDDLPAKKGASLECELTSGSDTYAVTVTVTSVEGGRANFDIKVADRPK